MNFFYWFFWLLCRTVFKSFYWMEVEGAEKRIEEGGAIIASNHASFLDPPLVGSAYLQKLAFLARSTLFEGMGGWLLPRINAVPIDRDQADLKSMKTILRALKDGKRVVMFPEGTRTTDGKLQDAKAGIGMLVAKSKVPVQPVRVVGTYEAFPRTGKMQRKPLKVVIGDPIAFTPEELAVKSREGYQAIADRLMEEIAKLG